MELFNVIFRTMFFYFFITLAYRIMGKREVGQLGIIDLIVSILIAELVAISIENINDSIILYSLVSNERWFLKMCCPLKIKVTLTM